MTDYIAFLRGINVGKANRIRMEKLKEVFESIGCSRVETVLQSGNVLFGSDQPEEIIVLAAESALWSSTGIQTSVILRSAKELAQTISGMPFTAEQLAQANIAQPDFEHLYVCFASGSPKNSLLSSPDNTSLSADECRIVQRDAYLLLRQSIRTSKLANRVQKLLAPATIRNWSVVCRLSKQINARESSLILNGKESR